MSAAQGLQAAIERLRFDSEWAPRIVAWHTQRARPPTIVPVPSELGPEIKAMLARRGITGVYAHQAQAARMALSGQHIVVVTPTASGKTLCYLLPVLYSLLKGPARSLLLFPTKALAHDQQQHIAQDLEALGLDRGWVAAYDGDASPGQRTSARETARILITNPDMLHMGILPNHVRWRDLLGNLSYVALDEMHSYRGVFGSQVAGVLWRLRRLCGFYGCDPRFVCTSATVANPVELASALVGEAVALVSESGAPEPPREIVLYNPPVLDSTLGIRRSAAEDAGLLAMLFLEQGLQTVCFARSRMGVEQFVIALRRAVPAIGLDPEVIRGYRAGYLSSERRQIEAGVRDGSVRCIVATSALELGIDIGGLAVCILVGYPGSTSSLWQRIGRAGRGPGGGLAVLVASDSPLDQYLLAHDEQLLGAAPEAARINAQNLHVRIGQMRSALYELAMPADEARNLPAGEPIVRALEGAGEARLSAGRWFWASPAYPAGEISLRTADPRRVEIVSSADDGKDAVVGQVEASEAPRWVHPNAVYLHEGNQFLVRSLDLDSGIARVESTSLPYITVASERTEIEVERVDRAIEMGALTTSYGDIRVTSQVTSYRLEDLETHQVLSRQSLDLPEQVILTQACWLGIQRSLVDQLESRGLWQGDQGGSRGPNWQHQRAMALARDGQRCRQCGAAALPGRSHDVHHIVPFQSFGWIPGQNEAYLAANRLDNLITLCSVCHRLAERQVAVTGTLTDLGHLLRFLVPLWVLCDPTDIGTHVEADGRRLESPTLFVYDRAPGGSGIAESLPPLVVPLLEAATERVQSCGCDAGCPSCIGPSLASEPERKRRVRALVSGLLSNQQCA
ncbi:MAG: DEAD/DEAH box helicase [Anaerolineae bacterium]